ncbi:MAG: type I restriction endonuclease [bacterium]
MELANAIQQIANNAEQMKDQLQTEEATKTALIMPFIAALGYNVFDPREVMPEIIADVGVKKGEKVDYAIMADGKPMIIFECKKIGAPLNLEHASQLFRYFAVTDAKFAVLTNGVKYRFFTDLTTPNRMDEHPFFEFNIHDFRDQEISELEKFRKSVFNVDVITESASDLKFTRAIKKALSDQFTNPSEEFVRVLISDVYQGRFTANAREQFIALTRKASAQFLREKVNERLKDAMQTVERTDDEPGETEELEVVEHVTEEVDVETTYEEIQGHMIIRAISSEIVDANRVAIRDGKSYCAILFDDNNRKPICRLHFNSKSVKRVEFFNADKSSEQFDVQDPVDIYKYRSRVIAVVNSYLGLGQNTQETD